MKKTIPLLHQSLIWTGDARTLRQSALLGLIYAIQLFAYQLFVLVLQETGAAIEKNDITMSATIAKQKDWIALFLHLGMLTGAIVWAAVLLKKHSLNRALNCSLMTSAMALLIQSLVFSLYPGKTLFSAEADVMLMFGRFLFGVGFSAGLAIVLTLIHEQMPPYLMRNV